MGVFRIARAEFIKIFKKPSVYLMGVILAAVLVLSLLFFEPIGKQNYSVKLDGSTVGQVYDMFTNDNNISSGDIKKSKYDEQINNNLTKINFYKVLNSRNEELFNVNSDFIVLYNDLKDISNSGSTTDDKINEAFTSVKNKIRTYGDVYNNITTLSENCEFYSHFTTLTIYTDAKNVLDELISRSSDGSSVVTFINFVENNGYIEKLNNIYSINKNFVKSTLNYYAENIKTKQKDYYNRVINNTSSQDIFITLKNNLYSEINAFSDALNKLVNSTYSLTFIDKTEYENIKNVVTNALSVIDSYNDSNANLTDYQKHHNIVLELENISLGNKINDFVSTLINFDIPTTTLNKLEKTITERVEELKAGLISSIETLNKESSSSSTKNINALNDLITSYRTLSINTTTMVDNTINLEAIKVLDSNKINNYENFKEFNKYEVNEQLTSANYFIENGVYNQHYNDVFAFNKNSGIETNAYDFMFYAMKIATLIITVFAIFMAASLMASEYDSGTIKLLAMRPFKRWKIITGKLLATMIFVVLFVLFSFLISLVAGVCLYPIDSTPILAIFNATTAFSINPILLMLINLGFIILEIFFYTVIALSISTMFRSYTAAISISCIMFILALSLNILLGGAYWYSFIPFINADLFKYFGGSFLTGTTGGLSTLFSPTLLSNANFYISLSIYGGTILIFLAITYIVFKVKDF